MAIAADFEADVRSIASMVAAQALGTLSADVLRHGDRVIQSMVLPMLRQVRQDYLVRTIEALSYSGRVDLPERAVGAALRNVQLVRSGIYTPLPEVPLELAQSNAQGSLPTGYFFDGGGIVLSPRGASGTVSFRYFARPGRLALQTDTTLAALITSVVVDSPTPGRTTLNFAAFTGYTPTTNLVDVVSQGPAHEHLGINLVAASPTGTSCNVDSAALLGAVSAGAYICAVDRSPFVPLPEELYTCTVDLCAARVLRAGGYRTEATELRDEALEELKAACAMLQPRNEGSPKRIRGILLDAVNGGLSNTYRGGYR